jgi:hypothetical protein
MLAAVCFLLLCCPWLALLLLPLLLLLLLLRLLHCKVTYVASLSEESLHLYGFPQLRSALGV